MNPIDTISETREELSLDDLKYHPKIKERLLNELLMLTGSPLPIEKNGAVFLTGKLETCSPADLAEHQGYAKALRLMLKLPEKILAEERERKAKENGRPHQPERR